MASVAKPQAAPVTIPTGKSPAAAAVADPAGFARQLAELPIELLQVAATIPSVGGDAPAPQAKAGDAAEIATNEPADAASEADRLISLSPLLNRPLPRPPSTGRITVDFVPNTQAAPAPVPVPAGKIPAATADRAGFARQLAEIPEELRLVAATIVSAAGNPDTPDAGAVDDADTAKDEPLGTPSEADRLAALAPLLQSLPAVVAAPTPEPLPQSAPAVLAAPTPEPLPQSASAVLAAPTPEPLAQSAPAVVTAPVTASAPTMQDGQPVGAAPPQTQPAAPAAPASPIDDKPKADVVADKAPAPVAALPTAKAGRAEAEAPSDESDSPEPSSALDAAAKEALSTAKKVIEMALRAAGPVHAEAAPNLARAAAPLPKPAGHALPLSAAGPEAPIADIAIAAASAIQAAPIASAPLSSAPVQPHEAVAGPSADRALDLADDAQWLDRLARDIAQASGNEGTIRFRLHPQTLGHLRVELSQGDHGTSVRLTADTEQARAILADAQPRLIAEARAQGVRIAESHVDLSGSDRHFSGDPRRQEETRQHPMIRTARDAAADADAPERPGRSKSDRYA